MLTGLSNNERRYFLGISKGKIVYRPGKDAEPEYYDNFQGVVKSITKREALINEKPMLYYDIQMTAGDLLYVLSVPLASSVARSIILSLANIENIKGAIIKISPWKKDEYTNVSVYHKDQRVSWVVNGIPPLKEIIYKKTRILDDTERVNLVDSYVTLINERLHRQFNPETGELKAPEIPSDDDLPEDLG